MIGRSRRTLDGAARTSGASSSQPHGVLLHGSRTTTTTNHRGKQP